MIVDVSGINKLMDIWGEDCVCFFNETETTLIQLRNYFEDKHLNFPIEEIKYPYSEIEFNNNILLIVNNKKNRDDLKISKRDNIDLDV
jgi:hypothetical protein